MYLRQVLQPRLHRSLLKIPWICNFATPPVHTKSETNKMMSRANTTINSRPRRNNNSRNRSARSSRAAERQQLRRQVNDAFASTFDAPNPPPLPRLRQNNTPDNPRTAAAAQNTNNTESAAAQSPPTANPPSDPSEAEEEASDSESDASNSDDDAEDNDASLPVDPPQNPQNYEQQWPAPPPHPPNSRFPPVRVNRPKSYPSYASELRHFMRYTNKLNYPKDWVFSVEELLPITPELIYAYMAFKAFGKEDPSPNDNPQRGMSNSLLAIKKKLSYFMVNRIPSWDPTHQTGNPTKSTQLNDLIAFVKKKETRGQGKNSRSDRAFEHSEFKQVLDECHASIEADFDRKYRFPTMMKFMFHFIARGDDAAHVFKSSLVPSIQYPWLLTCKLRWSKNVRETRECPRQILLGSMNTDYCLMLSLSVFLESWISRGQGRTSQWLFSDGITTASSHDDAIDREAARCKTRLYSCIKSIVHSDEFVKDPAASSNRPLANHSVKKYATTHCNSRGCLKQFVNVRARWKSKKQIQDTYVDIDLPWPDVKAASLLCLGGICKYKVKSGVNISDNWLSNHVCPGITSCFGPRVAAILAKPLLWAAMDDKWCDYLPDGLRTRIMNSLAEDAVHLQVHHDVNPIERVTVLVAEVDGVPEFSEVDPEYDTGGGGGGGGAGGPVMMEWRNFVTAKICGMENRIHDLQSNQGGHHGELVKRLDKIERNMRRMSAMPARRVGASTGGGVGGANETEAVRPPNLSKCPKNLFVLWAEFESGVGGNKPARLFTASERGKVKFMYCRRNIVWDAIDNLVKRGLSSDVAIDRIYNECGGPNTKVNDVIAQLKQFRRTGNDVLHMYLGA